DSTLARTFHFGGLYPRADANQDWVLVYKLAHHFSRGDGDRRHHGRGRGLRDLAAELSWPAVVLVDDPGELHGSDPARLGRQPLYPDELVQLDQNAARRFASPAFR